MIFAAAIGAALASFAGWFACEIYRAPLVPNDPPDLVFLPEPDVVIVTSHGVEIPIAWLANADDLDDVLLTLAEIDELEARMASRGAS